MTRSEKIAADRGKLTGRKVALIFGGFFAVVITVNVILMVNAIDTFSGLVVPNSYVASQDFDRNRKAQEALGWDVSVEYREGAVYLGLQDAQENTVRPRTLDVVVGRPTTESPGSVSGLDGDAGGLRCGTFSRTGQLACRYPGRG